MAISPSTPLVLHVCQDAALSDTRELLLSSEGYLVASTSSIDDAVHRFRFGDFDLVIVCHSIDKEKRHSLIDQMRRHGSSTPIIDIAAGSIQSLDFSDAFASSVGSHPSDLLLRVSQVLEKERLLWQKATS